MEWFTTSNILLYNAMISIVEMALQQRFIITVIIIIIIIIIIPLVKKSWPKG